MIYQIAWHLSNGSKNWGTCFFIKVNGLDLCVTARHVLPSIVGDYQVAIREQNKGFNDGWKKIIRPILHPLSDLAIVIGDWSDVPYTPYNLGSVRVINEDVSMMGAANTSCDHGPLGKNININGKIKNIFHDNHLKWQNEEFDVDFAHMPGCSGAPVLNVSNDVIGIYSRDSGNGNVKCSNINNIHCII